MYLKGHARPGPTFREALLMHAVGRLALHPWITNIQASWVKLGVAGAQSVPAGGSERPGRDADERVDLARRGRRPRSGFPPEGDGGGDPGSSAVTPPPTHDALRRAARERSSPLSNGAPPLVRATQPAGQRGRPPAAPAARSTRAGDPQGLTVGGLPAVRARESRGPLLRRLRRPARADAGAERKIVTVLFADLVGFTARAERLDPEDVRAFLAPYHERLRAELERFGGTVEKFIGDAVDGGVRRAGRARGRPRARGARRARDPRRAARRRASSRCAIAVNTGEALVSLDAAPERGEGMVAGDVVNTASRLQAAAPVNGILVGERDVPRDARRDRLPRRRAGARRRARPSRSRCGRRCEARARFGVDVAPARPRPARRARARARALLARARARARGERVAAARHARRRARDRQEPARLRALRRVERRPSCVNWRQGRSLPYGEGVASGRSARWSRRRPASSRRDAAGGRRRSCRAPSSRRSATAEAAWVDAAPAAARRPRQRDASGSARREEAFAAWRRFFEALAEQRPLVLVFEDLHWADDALLDFVDHLVEWASRASRCWWSHRAAGAARAAARLGRRQAERGHGGAVAALGRGHGAAPRALLERAVLPAETQAALLERAGGNPLYAEEFARLLRRARLDSTSRSCRSRCRGSSRARLDALAADEKALLQDAAVIGKVFWLGALAASAARASRRELLHALERKEFVRRERRSSVAGESEYAFRHVLVRDVAYGQIPRAAAVRSTAAAEWIESLAGGGPRGAARPPLLCALELAGASRS